MYFTETGRTDNGQASDQPDVAGRDDDDDEWITITVCGESRACMQFEGCAVGLQKISPKNTDASHHSMLHNEGDEHVLRIEQPPDK